MEDWYLDDNRKIILVADGTDKANVSSKDKSEYLRPFERSSNQSAYNGCTWKMAHYLNPIMIKQFQFDSHFGSGCIDFHSLPESLLAGGS